MTPIPEQGSSRSATPPWRRWAIGAAVLVTLLVVALITLPRLVRPERFREPLERALAEATGWEASIGDLDFSVLRGLAVSASPVRLTAPGKGSSVEIGSLDLRARLVPLLRGRLEIRSIGLDAARIHLVRTTADAGWSLPFALAGPSTSAGPSVESPASKFELSLGRVEILDGSLKVEDLAAEPTFSIELTPIRASFDGGTGAIDLTAEVPEGRGEIHASGSPGSAIDIRFERIASGLFENWLAGLVQGDGRIDGTLRLAGPAVTGSIELRGARLLAGEAPTESLAAEFAMRRDGAAWQAERLELSLGAARVRGSGSVLPDLDLQMELPETPLGDALLLARAFFPLPLELMPPGSASARIRLSQTAGGALVTRGRGTIRAARFRIGGGVPDLADLRADFELTPSGELILEVADGLVAGGPVRGVARVNDLAHAALLTFDGTVDRARLGGLVGGFLPEAARAIEGPSDLDLRVALDLARIDSGPRALGGGLRLEAIDVALPGWDLQAALREEIDERLGGVAALLGKRGSAKTAAPEAKQLLQGLAVEFSFSEFPWSIPRVELDADGIRAVGSGRFDPVDGRIELALSAVCDEALTARLLERRPELRLLVRDDRIDLPLRVGGTMAAPTFAFDSSRLVDKGKKQEAAKDLLRRLLR